MRTPDQPPDNACLFLDVDGTIIDLAPTPDTVVVPPALVADLGRAERAFGGALAFVSGRSIGDLDRMFAPAIFRAGGVHGAEIRLPGSDDVKVLAAAPLPETLWTDLLAALDPFPGTLAENKTFSYAVHYRAVPASGPRLAAALDGFLGARTGLGLEILPGHFVYELKRPGVDKGAAIRAFMERAPFAGRMPVFIGDDVTDMAGFAAVRTLSGKAFSVSKVFPDVDGTFSGPAAVRRWLAEIGGLELRTS